MAQRIIINPTQILVVVPLVAPGGTSTSMFVQPGSRAEIPSGYEVREPYLQQHPRIRVITA